ncbi:nucleoside-diphosphate sugar epimerase/dehydratase [Pseudomonas putida]|uniref:nucleoside-diphosphate sugar epimerase/dehydratase n=1 Tax=Pseudomonas putida TaxID=303 RepID=UPI00274768F3|nr:LicD family protein [Pseudomonas putida]MDP9521005.1 LicD family protein [Pseudomonas putida]
MQNLNDKRVVLFGAGKSGGLFIDQHRDVNILAMVDNNPEKQGGVFHGVPVIAPTQIAATTCDVIVITSVWSDDILQQLKELGLSSIPTIVASKRQMKGMRGVYPFSHPFTKQVARELVLALDGLMSERGVDIYLDFGTLLGALREGDFIAWDDDIDFSVNESQFDLAIDTLRQQRTRLPQHPSIVWDVQLISSKGTDFGIRIVCNNLPGHEKVIPFEADIARRVRRDGHAVVVGVMPEWFCPERHFDGFEEVKIFGMKLKAPSDAAGYLDFVYGDWREPKKEMSFADYNNAGAVPFEDYENSIRPV